MIECQHKHVVAVLNRGIFSEFCVIHGKLVNSTICSQCPDCNGKLTHPPVEIEFPSRNNNEIKAIYQVCSACPLFTKMDQRCSKMQYELNPVDIWAQHPSNHCPKNQW